MGIGFLQPIQYPNKTVDVTWLDNIKATFGTAGDADIYYDGTNLILDPDVVGSGDVVISGGLTVNGTTTTLNATTLTIDDKNIEMGSVSTPSDITADGGGITLKGGSDKTLIWDNANDNWTSNQDWNIASGKVFKINNTSVLNATTLGSAVVASSLTSVGTLTALQVDNLNINGNTISSTAGTDLLITPLSGQQIVLDGAIVVDAGVVTGATSITSTAFVGALTGNASGTAATVTTAAQTNITSLGTLTALTGGTGDLAWDTDTLFVDSSEDKVGIGLTNPGAVLELGGSGANKLGMFRMGPRNTAQSAYGLDMGCDPTTGDPVFSRIVDNVVSESFRIQRSSGNILPGADNAIDLGSASLTWKDLYLSGKVGIGTTTPGLSAVIVGAHSETNNNFSGTPIVLGLANTNTTDDNYSAIAFGDSASGGGFCSVIQGITTNHTSNYGSIAFITRNSSGFARRLTIENSGDISGTHGDYHVASDVRLKENVVTIPNALAKVTSLRGVNFTWIDTENRGSNLKMGLIAQEVEAVVPEVVHTQQDTEEQIKSVEYQYLVGLLIEAVKELKVEVDALTV